MIFVLPYKIRKIISKLARKRVVLLIITFVFFWFLGAFLFHETEKPKVSIGESLYWALITMSTVGYGDIVPSNPSARAVAAATSVFGIATYTLLISTLADFFLGATVKLAMGMGRLKGKRFLVVGEGPVCEEAIKELSINGYSDETGWIRESQPKGDPGVDFIVGALSEDTLRRAGADKVEHIIICYDDDSKNLHAAALSRRINPSASIIALARDRLMVEILKEIGVKSIVPLSVLGRLLASSAFEPAVTTFISDATTARSGVDLIEIEAPGKLVEDVEKEMKIRAVAIVTSDKKVEVARANRKLLKGEKLVAIREVEERKR